MVKLHYFIILIILEVLTSTVIESGVGVRVPSMGHERLLSVPVCLMYEPVRVSMFIIICVYGGGGGGVLIRVTT